MPSVEVNENDVTIERMPRGRRPSSLVAELDDQLSKLDDQLSKLQDHSERSHLIRPCCNAAR